MITKLRGMGHFLKQTAREIVPQCSKFRIICIPGRPINHYFKPTADGDRVEYSGKYRDSSAADRIQVRDRIDTKLNRGRPVITGKTGWAR
ncbi:hypothetical protein [Roseobacter sinensis]|uniref:Uncharacterized protein n=1 Tax=Roseobacter sinensis TaxID=2931391 RepID=A0ABT3BGA1_9RHOB|nr:hypothetical protein [Roseobacter sp. WL0113]MCV3272198.1 hypothetical protein [Roseobacter sp. WL0113]